MNNKVVLRKRKGSIREIKPEQFGTNNRKLSEKIDEILETII
ncbi:MAG: hypothetical protein OIN89_09530 [Candidatus Methanoperedens sp.]|nr:hypothetical protein [Candidatus Methanoperedens sp.]